MVFRLLTQKEVFTHPKFAAAIVKAFHELIARELGIWNPDEDNKGEARVYDHVQNCGIKDQKRGHAGRALRFGFVFWVEKGRVVVQEKNIINQTDVNAMVPN